MLNVDNWYYFPFGTFSAKENMAIDHHLASEFKNYKRVILRFYKWKPYCISIGYHQNQDLILRNKILQDGYDIIRRPTGGRAVFHSNELSYAIIYPKELISKFDLYRQVHHSFSAAINTLGVTSELKNSKKICSTSFHEKDTFSCFASSAQYEVEAKAKKLIGSAQRIYPNAILQHGSILLGDEHLDLLNYLSISDNSRYIFRNELKEVSAFLDLKRFAISLNDLIQYFLKSFEKTFHFRSIVKLELNVNTLKYDF